ncbi:hypothetical protein [Ferruginibacter sp.]
MEKYSIEKDIPVICVQAESFPLALGKAYQTLHELIQHDTRRKLYGISFGSKDGGIIYKAAAEEAFEGEAEKLHCEKFIIRKGTYASETLKDWRTNEGIVATTFRKLLTHPQVDHNGYCVEIYPNGTDMICLVKLSADDRSV